jgi:hypothetical protein
LPELSKEVKGDKDFDRARKSNKFNDFMKRVLEGG